MRALINTIILLIITIPAYGQTIVGGAGICHTNGDPNIAIPLGGDAKYSCRVAVDTTSGFAYERVTGSGLWVRLGGGGSVEVKYLDDYAALSSFSGDELAVIIGDDLTGGTFISDPTATTVDGGVVPVSGWRRIFSGPISASWFGVIGDGVYDNTAAIASAISYIDSKGGGFLLFDGGQYLVDSINIDGVDHLRFEGSTVEEVIFSTRVIVDKFFAINRGAGATGSSSDETRFANFRLSINHKVNYGLYENWNRRSDFENIKIRCENDGVVLMGTAWYSSYNWLNTYKSISIIHDSIGWHVGDFGPVNAAVGTNIAVASTEDATSSANLYFDSGVNVIDIRGGALEVQDDNGTCTHILLNRNGVINLSGIDVERGNLLVDNENVATYHNLNLSNNYIHDVDNYFGSNKIDYVELVNTFFQVDAVSGESLVINAESGVVDGIVIAAGNTLNITPGTSYKGVISSTTQYDLYKPLHVYGSIDATGNLPYVTIQETIGTNGAGIKLISNGPANEWRINADYQGVYGTGSLVFRDQTDGTVAMEIEKNDGGMHINRILEMENHQVKEVAPGTLGTDAVNLSQLIDSISAGREVKYLDDYAPHLSYPEMSQYLGSSTVRVAFIGDSNGERSGSFPTLVTLAGMVSYGFGGIGYLNPSWTDGDSNPAWGWGLVTRSAGWTVYNKDDIGIQPEMPFLRKVVSSNVADTVRFEASTNTVLNGDKNSSIKIFSGKNGAAYEYRINNGTWQTVTTPTGGGIHVENINSNANLERIELVITIRPKTGALEQHGVSITSESGGEGSMVATNLSVSGASSSTHAAIDRQSFIDVLEATTPSIVLVAHSTNDQNADVTPAQHRANLDTIADRIVATLGYEPIFLNGIANINESTATYPMSDYADVVVDMAKDRGARVIDLYSIFSPNGAYDPEYFTDGIHYTTEQMSKIAKLITDELNISSINVDRLTPFKYDNSGVKLLTAFDENLRLGMGAPRVNAVFDVNGAPLQVLSPESGIGLKISGDDASYGVYAKNSTLATDGAVGYFYNDSNGYGIHSRSRNGYPFWSQGTGAGSYLYGGDGNGRGLRIESTSIPMWFIDKATTAGTIEESYRFENNFTSYTAGSGSSLGFFSRLNGGADQRMARFNWKYTNTGTNAEFGISVLGTGNTGVIATPQYTFGGGTSGVFTAPNAKFTGLPTATGTQVGLVGYDASGNLIQGTETGGGTTQTLTRVSGDITLSDGGGFVNMFSTGSTLGSGGVDSWDDHTHEGVYTKFFRPTALDAPSVAAHYISASFGTDGGHRAQLAIPMVQGQGSVLNFRLFDPSGGGWDAWRPTNSLMTENLIMDGNWVSSSGQDDGIFIAGNSNVGVGTNLPLKDLHVNGLSAFGDAVTSANSIRSFNVASSDATLRVLRVTSDIDVYAPAIEIMHRTSADGANTSWWDFYSSSTGLNFRDRANGNVVPFSIKDGAATDALVIEANGTVAIANLDVSTSASMSDNKITDVAPATLGTDAVNLDQLNAVSAAANTNIGNSDLTISEPRTLTMNNQVLTMSEGNLTIDKASLPTLKLNETSGGVGAMISLIGSTPAREWRIATDYQGVYGTGSLVFRDNGASGGVAMELEKAGGAAHINRILEMENHQVKEVLPGTVGTDAVNLDQLNAWSSISASSNLDMKGNRIVDVASPIASTDATRLEDVIGNHFALENTDVTITSTNPNLYYDFSSTTAISDNDLTLPALTEATLGRKVTMKSQGLTTTFQNKFVANGADLIQNDYGADVSSLVVPFQQRYTLTASKVNALGDLRWVVDRGDKGQPTGWASYVDTGYNSGSPFSLAADTKVRLPNNGGTVIESQLPYDLTTMFNAADTTIIGRNGDGLAITVEFTARPSSVAAEILETSIDIGGAVGEIHKRIYSFPKGNGVERQISFSINAYTLGTWEANGGQVLVTCDGPVDIYNVSYILTRTHKAVGISTGL